jgi:hypothetical protein
VSKPRLLLGGADADWFEQSSPAIPVADRYTILSLVLATLDDKEDVLRDTVVIVPTERGVILRMERQADGRVLVKVLGGIGWTTASFSFMPNDNAAENDKPRLSGLNWETTSLEPGVTARPIDFLRLPLGIRRNLAREQIQTIGELLAMTDVALRGMRGIGDGAIEVIDRELAFMGLNRKRD